MKSAATRASLIAAARQLFTEAGYHGTGTNDLVALASVTRGALYHHFVDKEALFEAVFLEVYEELARKARNIAAATAGDIWNRMTESFVVSLKLRAESKEAQQILLIDGPVVFGWERWRQLQSASPEGLATTLRLLMDRGIIARRQPDPLAQLIVAALNAAALAIAHAEDPKAELAAVTDALMALVEGLRISEGTSN